MKVSLTDSERIGSEIEWRTLICSLKDAIDGCENDVPEAQGKNGSENAIL